MKVTKNCLCKDWLMHETLRGSLRLAIRVEKFALGRLELVRHTRDGLRQEPLLKRHMRRLGKLHDTRQHIRHVARCVGRGPNAGLEEEVSLLEAGQPSIRVGVDNPRDVARLNHGRSP